MDYNFDGISIEEALKIITEEMSDPKERRKHEREIQLNEIEMAMKILLRKVRKDHEILEHVVEEIVARRCDNVLADW